MLISLKYIRTPQEVDDAFTILANILNKYPELINILPKNETLLPIIISKDEQLIILQGEVSGKLFQIDSYIPPQPKMQIPQGMQGGMMPMMMMYMQPPGLMPGQEEEPPQLETPKDIEAFLKRMIDGEK